VRVKNIENTVFNTIHVRLRMLRMSLDALRHALDNIDEASLNNIDEGDFRYRTSDEFTS
jgi:hypothetical protein